MTSKYERKQTADAMKENIHEGTYEKSVNSLPIDDISWFSFISYSWLTKFMWSVYQHGLRPEEVPVCSPLELCDQNCKRLEYLWKSDLKLRGNENANLLNAVWRFVRSRVFLTLAFFMTSVITSIIGPTIFLRKLLEYASQTEVEFSKGFIWLFGLSIMEILRILMFACMWVTSYRTALRLRSALLTMLYRKIMRLRTLGGKTTGEFINLFMNDDARIFEFVTLGPLIVRGPVVTIGGIIFVGYLLGFAALAGMATFILFYPIQYLLTKLNSSLRKQTVQVTDERVRSVNEMVSCIKLIKVNAWEKAFNNVVSEIRKKESKLLEKSAFVQSVNLTVAPTVPIIASVVTFLAHVSAGNNLSAAEAFSVVAAYKMIQMSLSTLPQSVKSLIEMLQSLTRMQDILLMEEKISYTETPSERNRAIVISEASFAWDNPENSLKNGNDKSTDKNFEKKTTDKAYEERKTETKLFDINLTVNKGDFIGICGHVGSGKTSLLASILNQMRIVKGNIACQGTIAYVAQQPWILNASIKDNVLFGEKYDFQRYQEAIRCCGLDKDIESFPSGDETEVGERGQNMSGGQKQRLSLARAVYSNRDIYLLDDSLSAVDAHVGKHIFEQCIQKALRGKTVLFITHQVQYLYNCDAILLMKEGKIEEYGTHQQLMSRAGEYANLIRIVQTKNEVNTDDTKGSQTIEGKENMAIPSQELKKNISKNSSEKLGSLKNSSTNGKAVKDENVKKSKLDYHMYLMYMKSAGGYFVSFIVLLVFIINIGSTAFSTWWLSKWINEGSGNAELRKPGTLHMSNNITDNPDLEFYKIIYAMSVVGILVTSFLRSFLFLKATLKASNQIHDNVFNKVFYSPMKFFDTTPVGKIINLFGRDMDEIDVRLPFSFESFLQNFCTIFFSLIFIVTVFPLFVILAVVLGILFYYIYTIFRVAVRKLKQIETATRSPIYSHVAVTMQGLTTIHAYEKESEFTTKFMQLVDNNTSPFFLFNCAARWLSLRLDLLVVSITVITGLFVVLMHGNVSASYAGLALSYAVPLTGLIQFTVRLSTETEARFMSVERLYSYIKQLTVEKMSVKEKDRPLPSWPKEGVIEFINVNMRYRPDQPLVLKNLRFTIGSAEKVGIVGRTGSGKSSLGTALFRLVELASGKIQIDGIDISKIGLEDLRSKISLIPQDPVLFKGTIRYNLDPFSIYSDEKIWEALEKTCVKQKVFNLENQLHSIVTENGENFSIGERQLFCMARALLRNNKILLLDEATAAIDVETDALIQTTIRTSFKDCTIFIIAHRLNTVLECDRVMVLSDGEIKEFDRPSALLKQPNSFFASMMSASEMARERET